MCCCISFILVFLDRSHKKRRRDAVFSDSLYKYDHQGAPETQKNEYDTSHCKLLTHSICCVWPEAHIISVNILLSRLRFYSSVANVKSIIFCVFIVSPVNDRRERVKLIISVFVLPSSTSKAYEDSRSVVLQ